MFKSIFSDGQGTGAGCMLIDVYVYINIIYSYVWMEYGKYVVADNM